MGDGGVACMPLQQQQQHNSIMERFPISDKTISGDNSNNNNKTINTSSSSDKNGSKNNTTTSDNNNNSNEANNNTGKKNGVTTKTVKKKIVKIKRVIAVKKKDVQKSSRNNTNNNDNTSNSGSNNNKEVENGGGAGNGVTADKDKLKTELKSEEVEEGELGTLKWENGEFVQPDKSQSQPKKSEIEKGEIVVSFSKWRGEAEKGEFVSGRGNKDDIEKVEVIPDRWHKGEVVKDEHGYSKFHRYDPKLERTPPSLKYSGEDYRRKEFNRSGSQHGKSSSRWEIGQERNVRISSKIVDEGGLYTDEYNNGKRHEREYSSGNRLKRHGNDPDIGERKYYGDFTGSKSRRFSDDYNNSSLHSEHYSRHSVERCYRNSSLSRMSSSEKYSSRHHESSLSSRVVNDRHGHSPGHSERSPRDRSRYYNHRDRCPRRRDRSPYTPDRSPYTLDRSPYSRDRSPYSRDRSPYAQEKSPYDRSCHYDHRNRSSIIAERSPQDRARFHDHRDRPPNYLEKSPLDRSRPNNNREASRKSGASEKHSAQSDTKGHEDKLGQRDCNARCSRSSAKASQDKSSVQDLNVPEEKNTKCESYREEQSQNSSVNCKESPHVDGPPPEELLSMEEDMDICDTPPHVPVATDSSIGKWYYLDHFGMECGPSKLGDLKALVEEGILVSDHFIKHLDGDRWVTVENAVSPLVTVNFPSITSDSITQLVNPPEAPGNLLVDTGDNVQSNSEEFQVTLRQPLFCPDENAAARESLEDLHIDVRVGALLEGFTVIPGKEIETLGEILLTTFERMEWQNNGGFTWHEAHVEEQEQDDQKIHELSRYSDINIKEATEFRLGDKDQGLASFEADDWFSGRWSCKGGDWTRNDEAAHDRCSRKKIVLSDGFPLCQMLKSGFEDPRWHQKDDLYYPSQSRRLDLPPWAFSCVDERNDGSSISWTTQNKPAVVRGVKGTMLSVVRINACVVNDHGSFFSEPRSKVRVKERYSSRSTRSHSSANDYRRSSAERDSHSKIINDQDSQDSWKSVASINAPKDRLCTVDDLQLHLGEWYYLDGTGHERGPSSFSELQVLVDQGALQKHTSVFRKFDKVWVPVSSVALTSEATFQFHMENNMPSSDCSGHPLTPSQGAAFCESKSKVNTSSFDSMHPQFIGYTRGKIHELVMKTYKNREFAAAINEVLDPWINAKQPKKETEHVYRKSERDALTGKRARLLVDGSEGDDETEEDSQTIQAESTFEDLCGDASFHEEESAASGAESGSWGLLNGHTLTRVFHLLRSDMKSLTIASSTCRHWRAAVRFYQGISRQVDLSSVGHNCTDSVIWNILNAYDKEKLNSMVLVGCTNITSGMLEEILCSFPHLSSIDIRGCNQFGELALRFPNMNWLKSQNSPGTKFSNDSHSKIRSLKQITEKSSSVSKTKGLGGDMDDFGALKDYFDSVDKRDSANQLFRRNLYKRSKVFDARKSSAILSRDARMRRWSIKKSENGYKRMEGFLALSLKEITRENTFDFFVPKVAEIEERIKNGYYISHGLSSVKDDISRMCRDAIKAKNSGGAGGMNRIITLFIQLASRLEQGAKSSYYEREEMMTRWKDGSPAGLYSAASKYKKKLKTVSERKYLNKSNGISFTNGDCDYGEYASDREIRKRLSKLNRKSLDSGSETSDDLDRSSEDGKTDSESTVSDTDSGLDFRSDGQARESRGDGDFMADDGSYFMSDEREWGARMTKASLVPPVTRKYEVIDQYVIVADEEDVKRKMTVSLPDDYAEKLNAQKNGSEELDMELPEVKDYKPRKQLGDEVIEQEVYGIDPYTHNLLLDSMPEELDWTPQEKHKFIEDVLLCTLNKQVRHFTGARNTPMMFPLQAIIEEIEKAAEEYCDVRTLKICQGILKAIDSRPDDKYVAYRKGLGVVCNKEGGFGEDDFVVEFLGEVYPVWKWFEKQDGIRSLQKTNEDPAPEFYNIYLERPKGDADGYDLVVVDAMHKANYASRICHSCRPNCEAKVTAVDGQYQIGIYAVRGIEYGEEITFDYNSVTESKEEYEASVCLCGSQVCRGSYLNLTGEGAFQKVLKECHGLLDRHQLLLEACELNSVSEDDYLDLGRAGLGSCLLGGLPNWVVAYSARLVRFINLERTKLPEEILRHNLEEKRKYFLDICLEDKSDAEVQAEGVYNQRLQNLAVTLDKVRYVMRCVFGDPEKAPPPLERLSPEETVSFLWKGEGSLVEELLQCMAPHVEEDTLIDLKSKIHAHDPSGSDDIQKELRKSLLWLRDEVRNLPCTYKCRHDAAADLIHIYAYTKCFFRVREYEAFTSPSVYISPLDLGPKYVDKLGAGLQEYRKTYGENYCLGQLIFWHIQTNADPDCTLSRMSKGCLSLPDIGSFYAKVQKPSRHRVYGPRTMKFMLSKMEKQPQRPWPDDRIWSFKSDTKIFGSPMLDAIVSGFPLDREMLHWLKQRPAVFKAMWDRKSCLRRLLSVI